MEDYSGLFLQWAMDTLQQEEHPVAAPAGDDCGECGATFPSLQALREASQAEEMVQELIGQPHAANSWSSGDGYTTDGSSSVVVGNNIAAATQPTSWNFSAAPALPTGPRDSGMSGAAAARSPREMINWPPPMRRDAVLKSMGSMYAQDHIVAERKRREKINQRFIELSTVIPGLKKMDKATILSDATRHVKELQEKLKALEGGGGGDRSIESWVLVKKPCITTPDEDSSPSSGMSRNPLPEIEAHLMDKDKMVMMRIHCEDGKGVAVRVLAEVDELHLSVIHANVTPFPASTLIITITAKVEEGFTVTADEIVGRLNSALLRSSSCRNSPEETGN
ncbi:unnamed protein product [Urochloa humidicola]